MEAKKTVIDEIVTIFSLAVQKTLESSTRHTIKISSTIQTLPKVGLRPDLGCFVQFKGDYSGLVIMNFSGAAAMELYRSYMITMGLPEEELARDHTSKEVEDTIGELTNQILGRSVRMVESKYDLISHFGQPKALALASAITLIPDTEYVEHRRISFRIASERFYMELAMEQMEFEVR